MTKDDLDEIIFDDLEEQKNSEILAKQYIYQDGSDSGSD